MDNNCTLKPGPDEDTRVRADYCTYGSNNSCWFWIQGGDDECTRINCKHGRKGMAIKVQLSKHMVVAKVSKRAGNEPCKRCYFSKNGNSTRTCPYVMFLDNENDQRMSRKLLCTVINTNEYTYFMKVND